MRWLWLFLALAGEAALACNDVGIDNFNMGTYSFNTDPSPALTLRVSRQGTQGCDFFIVISYGASSSFSRNLYQGAWTVPMNFFRDAGHTQIIKNFTDATSATDVIFGSFPNGRNPTSQILTYYPALGTLAYNRFGPYSDTFQFRLYQGNIGSATQRNARNKTFTYNMAKKIDVSLVSSGAPFDVNDASETINFGNLLTGATKSFDLIVKYNAGYRVTLSSANQGKLKHVSLPDMVNYALTMNSSPVNLVGSNSTPVQVATGTGVSPPNGLILSSTFTIGTVGTVRAGSYTDVITVSVATTE